MRIDVNRMAARIEENPTLVQSLTDVDLGYLITILAAYVSRGPDLATWLEGAQINRESSLRLQYLAGLAIEVYRGQEIYRSIARHHRYPDDIFVAPSEIRDRIHRRWFR